MNARVCSCFFMNWTVGHLARDSDNCLKAFECKKRTFHNCPLKALLFHLLSLHNHTDTHGLRSWCWSRSVSERGGPEIALTGLIGRDSRRPLGLETPASSPLSPLSPKWKKQKTDYEKTLMCVCSFPAGIVVYTWIFIA